MENQFRNYTEIEVIEDEIIIVDTLIRDERINRRMWRIECVGKERNEFRKWRFLLDKSIFPFFLSKYVR